MCCNPAEHSRDDGLHEYAHHTLSLSDFALNINYPQESPFTPALNISRAPLTSASEKLTTLWIMYHPKKVEKFY